MKYEGRYIQGRHAQNPTHRLFVNINELNLQSKNEDWLSPPHYTYRDISDNRQCVWYIDEMVPEKEPPPTKQCS